jgi:hypothetical protein
MEIRPREWAGSALVVGADDCLRGRIQPFQAVQRSANAGRVRFAAPCRWHLKCESEPLLCQTYHYPAYGHWIPPLAATKGALGVGSIPSPRSHSSRSPCPEFLNHGCQSPCAQVGGKHVRQRTRRSPRRPELEWPAPNRSWRRKGSSSRVAGNVARRVRGDRLGPVGSMVQKG